MKKIKIELNDNVIVSLSLKARDNQMSIAQYIRHLILKDLNNN